MITATKKKRPNKQHLAHGASFIRLAERVRKIADDQISDKIGACVSDALEDLADAIEAEGKATRKLR